MTCAYCGQCERRVRTPFICPKCVRLAHPVTQDAFEKKAISVQQMVGAIRMRRQSCKAIGGGRMR